MRILDSIDTEAILGSIRKDIDNILNDDYKEENYMYTKDFIAQVGQLKFVGEVVEYGADILVLWGNDGYSILSIDKGKFFNVRTDENGFEYLTEHQKSVLMDVVYPYISTPVEEREPEKRFRMIFKKNLKIYYDHAENFRYDKTDSTIILNDKWDNGKLKAIFTDSELKDLFTPEQLEWIEMTFDKEWVE